MTKQAQAITELALFGAIILFLLGVVLTYGLRQNYHQQVVQHAFRKAMSKSWKKMGGASYTLIHDRHIPSPTDTHGVGSIATVSSSAYVMRDYKMGMRDDLELNDMPRAYIGIGKGFTVNEYRFYAAGLERYCWSDPCLRFAVRKYEEIFNPGNVEDKGCDDGECCVRVMDSCEGELISYDGCRRICRQFTDQAYCVEQCNLGKLSGINCANICAEDVPIPAYCGVLDSIFGFATTPDMREMGAQPDMLAETYREDTMTKTETPGGIQTTDVLASGQGILRRIIYKPMGSLSWAEIGDLAEVPIAGVVDMEVEWP